MANLQSPFRNWATVAAFTLIIALTIVEGLDEGFSVWDWIIMALGAIFIVQALVRLNANRSADSLPRG